MRGDDTGTDRARYAPRRTDPRTARPPEKLRNIEVWARSAPIRLAGYEDDLAEPHILPGID
ncbi:hypothetical protein ID875_26810 [Streptomyces globisporus]|uniref:Uncharacterized protein n=1 Tax=Streptomyces globisporus TaxID=1908 RepID=A0A927BN77_STRGL|nr:hypothetical protein [Streptomyces globisporus]